MENKPNIINSRNEVIQIVDSFYAKVKLDPVIGPIFNDVAKVDWHEHMPKLYNFWEDLLFGTDNYKGRPFPPHMKLNLQSTHFEIWLKLFTETIDENYQGIKAEEMKARARRIALNFSINLGLK
ncbi:group III truncated hemoglobin [bacterium]|nr:group III truncated hemoglobin [bacterium]